MIYVISNVDYPESNKLRPLPQDLLVFLNRAKSIEYYTEHANKVCIHRSPDESYGTPIEGVRNLYIYGGGLGASPPRSVLEEIDKTYDWHYKVVDNGEKSPTTGYLAVKCLEKKYPDQEIVLVNFGYNVKKSSYRCPWHNWKFEDKALAEYPHIYTTELREKAFDTAIDTEPNTVYYQLSGWLGDQIYASAILTNMVAAGLRVNVGIEGHRELWENCPLLDRSITPDNADNVIRQHYDKPWVIGSDHIIKCVTDTVAQDLGISIPNVAEFPHIWASPPAARLIEEPYALILTGWQDSAPAKKWSQTRWAELIKRCPDIRFVQVGQTKNHAIPLDGAINMIDKTPLLDFLRLVRDARCVISPPSGIVHAAAAYRTPVVMLSGGREPASLVSYNYPNFISISRCGGVLECCKDRGCHKNWFSGVYKRCKHHTKYGDDDTDTSDCMLSISANEVALCLRLLYGRQ